MPARRTTVKAPLGAGGHIAVVTTRHDLESVGGEGCYYTVALHTLTPSGRPSKAKYYAEARLTRPLKRYDCGSTVGHGFWTQHRGTDPVGAACAVYGWVEPSGDDKHGGLMVALPKGGYTVTEQPKKDDADVPAVEILDPAVQEALDAAIEAVANRREA